MKDFAAIDFETANECPSSVCSVGIVVVRDGRIEDRFYSLIHPEPDYYQWFCRKVHGLGPEDTEDAPVFPYVWERVEPLVEGLPLVAHNSPFDEGCLKQVIAQPPAPDCRSSLRIRSHTPPSCPGRRRSMRLHCHENTMTGFQAWSFAILLGATPYSFLNILVKC